MPELDPLRIGVILIHGIGDQERHEHVKNVARHFVDIAVHKYSSSAVSVSSEPGYKNKAPVTLHICPLNSATPKIDIDFHEVWWRDLGDQKSFGRLLKFWFWALSSSGTRGQFADHTPEFQMPKNRSAELKRVGLINRLKLFLTTTFFFIMLAPIWLITNLVSIIPGLPKIRVFDAVFSYMSSVKLYQDYSDALSGTLADFAQPRRFSIQRRVAEMFVHVRRQDYDRWYVAGHSLGSIIAFKALFSGGHSLARLLSRQTWEFNVPREFRLKVPAPQAYPDEPKCPTWLKPDDAIDMQALLQGCAGFISWGSPLETFAHTWPATIPISKHFPASGDFEWINIFDAADIVASKLTSFNNIAAGLNGPISPVNISTKSHSFIAFSHTHYLHTKGQSDQESKVGFTLLEWMIGNDRQFLSCAERQGLQLTLPHQASARRLSIGAQFVLALMLGFLLWPKAIAILLGFVYKLPKIIIGLFSMEWANNYEEMTSSFAYALQETSFTLDFALDAQIVLYTGLVLFVFASMRYLLIRP